MGSSCSAKCDDEHQYRKKWFPSEAAMNEAMVRAVSSVSASDLIDFKSAGLLSKAQRDIHPPGLRNGSEFLDTQIAYKSPATNPRS